MAWAAEGVSRGASLRFRLRADMFELKHNPCWTLIAPMAVAYLPRPFLALSCMFFAYHFCPVAVFLLILACRIFMELLYFFLSLDAWPLSYAALFLLGHGLLYFAKVLLDSICDFFSFQVSSPDQFLNFNAHERLERYIVLARERRVSESVLAALFSVGGVVAIGLTTGVLRLCFADNLCTVFVVLALSIQCIA
jgi:hypothetical protein